jgi:Heavy-metal resistance protein CzcE
MTTKPLLSVLIATTLAAGASGLAVAAEQPRAFLGKAAPEQAEAGRVIVITDATRYVNVSGGQTVRFVVGDRSFTWRFQSGIVHVTPFDLQKIAPQGVLNHRVTAYVADDPLYQGA